MKILLSIAGTDAGVKAADALKALLLSTPLGTYEAGHVSYSLTFPAIHVRGEWALAKASLDENEAAGRWLRRVEISEPLEPKVEVFVMQTAC